MMRRVPMLLARVAKNVRQPMAVQVSVRTVARPAFVQFSVRSFASAANEPFLDPKVVTERIIEVVKNFEKVEGSKVTATARFKEDLDLDSLDGVEIVMAIEEEFCIEIPDSEADKIHSIPDAVAYVSGHPMAK